ncbi:MAG TPA: YwqG family protein [Ktedonobacterales bacterium]|nr:YwqG family protein [Ktedonobacterales bacterium]
MTGAPDERLREHLHRAGLAHRADDILAIAAPCIWLDSRRDDENAIATGASKLGGAPDLPNGVEWPRWRDLPMGFIAQTRLDEVALYDDERILPATGLLSYFFATDGEPKGSAADDDPTSWRVLYLDGDPATFLRRSPPADLDEFSRWPASTLTCSRWITLPSTWGPEYVSLGLTDAERVAYVEVESRFHEGERNTLFGTYLLGHAYTLNGSALLRPYRMTHGLPYPGMERYPKWPHGKERERMRARLAEVERTAAQEWRLLFQVESGASDMDWAGGGILHVTIPRAALLRRDFSLVWMDLDFV